MRQAGGHRRLWVLHGFDPHTAMASKVVAVAGVADGDEAVSWIPLEHLAAQRWRQILASSTAPLEDTLGYWADAADGVTLEVNELVDPPPSSDLRGAVETVVDLVLAGEEL